MSSVYRNQWEREVQREINELLEKKVMYGWTQADADRYNYLVRELETTSNQK